MKISITLLFVLFVISFVQSQDGKLTIAECYELGEANYPLIAQKDLIEQTRLYSVENASKGYLPQVSIGGQATYQSDVTRIPLEMPGVEPLSKDQYRIFGEISQSLYNGGLAGQQRSTEEINAAVESQKLEVELYQVKNRINELFFGILLFQEQRSQSELVKQDLSSAIKKVDGGIRHGTALRSAADVLHAELLRLDQRIIELESAESSLREMLGIFINRSVGQNTVLERPVFSGTSDGVERPELELFNFQKQSIEVNRSLLAARKKPRVELFVQGGYGRPALNMLENTFEFYYLGGIRFHWQLGGYYTFRRGKQILDVRQQTIDVQQKTFLFNIRLTSRQQESEITRLQRLIAVDDEIITLRERVQKTASAQLEEGVISSNDYIREVNAADQAKQNRALHETQLLMAQAKLRFTTGH